MYFNDYFILYIYKMVNYTNGTINMIQPLGFICAVMKCQAAGVATKKFWNVYLSKQ